MTYQPGRSSRMHEARYRKLAEKAEAKGDMAKAAQWREAQNFWRANAEAREAERNRVSHDHDDDCFAEAVLDIHGAIQASGGSKLSHDDYVGLVASVARAWLNALPTDADSWSNYWDQLGAFAQAFAEQAGANEDVDYVTLAADFVDALEE